MIHSHMIVYNFKMLSLNGDTILFDRLRVIKHKTTLNGIVAFLI